MSQRDHPHRDATPEIPRLPAPPTIARASRTRQVPSSGTVQAAAGARAAASWRLAQPRCPTRRGHVEETTMRTTRDVEDACIRCCERTTPRW